MAKKLGATLENIAEILRVGSQFTKGKETSDMTIHLPKDLESSIEAVVHSGHFASVDDAMAEAARMLLRNYKQPSPTVPHGVSASPTDPVLGSIGALSEDAELLDEIVADAYRRRREDRPRKFDL